MKDNFIKQEIKDIKEIFNSLRKRDFSGNKGQAIKNSSYQFATTLIAKFGSLFFIIIIARMLMPELFGLYSLALSTIVLFSVFSNFGIGAALMAFTSKFLAKKDFGKAKGYFKALLKFKVSLILIASFILILSAYPLSNFYYNKPIFLALLVGALYLAILSLLGFVEQSFRIINNFKYPMIKEIIFQTLRLGLVPLSILIFLKYSLSSKFIIPGVILILSFCYLLALLFLVILSKKELFFLRSKEKKITKSEKNNIKIFILPLVATAFSGAFLGSIDTIMLGHFVESSFLGYYGAAFALITSASAMMGFAASSLFPIFSRLRGKTLERGFKKSIKLIFLISFFSAILTFLLAPLIVKFIYGDAYLSSIIVLRLFSLLLINFPLANLYDTYFLSQGKTKILAKLLIGTTILNIFLNYSFITFGLKYSMLEAIIGAGIATVISRYIYLGGLMFYRRR